MSKYLKHQITHRVRETMRNLPMNVRKKIYNYSKSICADIIEAESRENELNIWPDDVFLVSYPRSGNTWLRYLLTNLRFPDAEWNLSSLLYAFPEINTSINFSMVPRPRWIKSHFSYVPSYPKVIYLVRDGRDVAVSKYFWSGYDKICSFEKYVTRKFLKDSITDDLIGTWHNHVESWMDNLNRKKILLIQYEKLVATPVTEIQYICQFVGLHRDVREIELAIERSTFQKQQADYRKSKIFANKLVGVKGGPGKWKEFFDEQYLIDFLQVAGSAMRLIGYK